MSASRSGGTPDPPGAFSCRRDLFDLPTNVTYLNCAYMGPLSRSVYEAGRRGLERKMRPWEIQTADFFEPVEEARELFARVIGADADGVALLPSVSYGIATAAQNVLVEHGGRILLLDGEYPSNVYAWWAAAERDGAEVVYVPRPPDHDWTSALLAHVDDRTNVVAVPNAYWTDGGLIDLSLVGERVRDVGAALVVDATQSVGAMPFDVVGIQPDFVVTAAYKWLLGPYGWAFMWVAPEYRNGRPIEYSWMARQGSEDFNRLVQYSDTFRSGARRYDVGEVANFAVLPAVIAALRQTLQWGVTNIAAYARDLTLRLEAAALGMGFDVPPAQHRVGHMLGIRLAGADPERIAQAMRDADVHVSVRGDAMRVSPHVYNDAADVDRLGDVLRAALHVVS